MDRVAPGWALAVEVVVGSSRRWDDFKGAWPALGALGDRLEESQTRGDATRSRARIRRLQ